jgi:hypothetical protein
MGFGRAMTTSSLLLKTRNWVTKSNKYFLCLLRDGSREKCKCSKGIKGRKRRMGNREDHKLYFHRPLEIDLSRIVELINLKLNIQKI